MDFSPKLHTWWCLRCQSFRIPFGIRCLACWNTIIGWNGNIVLLSWCHSAITDDTSRSASSSMDMSTPLSDLSSLWASSHCNTVAAKNLVFVAKYLVLSFITTENAHIERIYGKTARGVWISLESNRVSCRVMLVLTSTLTAYLTPSLPLSYKRPCHC